MKKGLERVYKGEIITLFHQNFPKKSLGTHTHHEAHLIIPLEGTVSMKIQNIEHIVKAGQMIFVGAQVQHDFSAIGESGERLIFQLNMPHKREFKKQVSLIPTHQLLKSLAFDLFTYSQEKYIGKIEELIIEITLSHLSIQKEIQNELFKTQSSLLKRNHQQFQIICKLMEDNLNAKRDFIAKEAGVSPRTMTRIIRDEINLSPNDLHTYYRIQKACILIYQNTFNLTSIAYECGYDSLSQFINNFKKWTGSKPSLFK